MYRSVNNSATYATNKFLKGRHNELPLQKYQIVQMPRLKKGFLFTGGSVALLKVQWTASYAESSKHDRLKNQFHSYLYVTYL